ncbi:Arc family DNA-binding protein [Rhizobium sp. CNPSo 4062]|uniref:Arc family DNA-binding protein n=1 Tax=Rhizobium sp. CNPSo 4062 TaxID=3021410 RepID=UPI00254E9352|nr:Arc family DNA-binding protein [Rhizobium sp. CNPSo 4062]MDK4704352.1 Arc family DNA-binding protein [Rhizobium sp. CNPSo 4062]
MARDDEYFRLRISEGLKRRVYEASVINQRSMTAEIVARLEASFLLDSAEGEGPVDPEVAEILADFERLKSRVIRLAR